MHPDTPGSTVKGDIAIVGMSCLLPGAADLDTYWQNIVTSVDAVTDPPPEAWEAGVFYQPDSSANDRVYCKRGGFISALTYFDPLEHGVMPRAVDGSEPDQWLALQVARAALADAGYGDDIPERERTAVILGKGTYLNRGNLGVVQHGQVIDQTLGILKELHPEYTDADLGLIRNELKQQLPPFGADSVPGLIPNIIAGRIANRLNLMGPSYTVDAACASSLVAVDIAMRALCTGQCDLALVGGVHVVTPVPVLMLFCQLNALSRRERIRPFDKDADGTILGEGLGMVVLKRLEDARRDGRRIYAVIKGVGVSSDGLGLSIMAPRLEGEVLAMQRAYASAGLSPRTVGLIEAHGTGTPVGDETEVQALAQVFGPRDGALPWCALGSVKSMIGHLMPAAGIAGLIKTALALYHKVLPPTLNVAEPSAKLRSTPFYVNTEARPWVHDARETPRRAGVNAFGFGGINAHVILEEPAIADATASSSRHLHWETEVCVLAAESRVALVERIRRLQGFLEETPKVPLKDVAYTLNTALDGHGTCRLAVVAASPDDLQAKLDRAARRLSDSGSRQIKDVQGLYFFEKPLAASGQLAFLFPGEGSQYVGMLADLCLHFPEVREHFDLIDRVFSSHVRNYVPSDVIFPRPGFTEAERKEAEAKLWQMEGAIEAVLTANRALWTLLGRLGIRPDCIVGHSTGEYSAMLASGMLALESEESVSRFSTELNSIYRDSAGEEAIASATLMAVVATSEQVSAIVDQVGGDLYAAMDNCPHQTVILGETGAVDKAVEEFRRQGLIYERLRFDRPYHTPLFGRYVEKLRPFFARWIAAPPRIKTYSCTTRAPFTDDVQLNQAVAAEHWLRPVEFRKTIEAMYADGVRLFVEVGASGNLTSFVNDILRGRPHLAAPANVKSRSGITQLNHLVGLLAAHGTPMKLDYLYQRRAPRKLVLDGTAESGVEDRQSGARMKLATGWPAMRLSPETAARLRAKSRTPRAAASPEPPPVAATDGRTGRAGLALPPPAPAAPVQRAVIGAEPTSVSRPAQPPPPAAGGVMSAYLHAMDQFLSVQQDVMQVFLTRSATAPFLAGMPAHGAEAAGRQAVAQHGLVSVNRGEPPAQTTLPVEPAPRDGGKTEPSGPGPLDAEAMRDVLLGLVSERTGYPLEMLDLDLDLEAHLGIDSIKRVEILGSFQQQTGLYLRDEIEALSGLKTLQEMLSFLAAWMQRGPVNAPAGEAGGTSPILPGAAAQRAAAPAAATMPLIGTVVDCKPGEEVVARCQVRLDEALYLLDHALGRQLSVTDPDLHGLPLVPLTFSIEMLAEGAALLAPGLSLVAMRDVRAYRWITLDAEAVTLEVVGRRKASASGREVYAFLREAGGESAPSAAPIIEGTMVFAGAVPEPPEAGDFALRGERPSRWVAERLYQDGMFHGPAFRGVISMDRVGEDGAEATLAVKPAHGLLRSSDAPAFLTDAVLLDQPGQVVGFWAAECLDSAYVVFPFSLEALYLYRYPRTAERATCRARIHVIDEHRVRSDLDVVGQDGRVWARFVGWEDRRFDLPRAFYRFLLAPQQVALSEPWPAPVAPLSGLEAYRLGTDAFPRDFFTAHGGIWSRVLAHLILSRRERASWRDLRLPERRRVEWLLGRMAAKDAVREHVRQRHGLILSPADVEILPDAGGRPLVRGAWLDSLSRAPVLSISHSAGMAVAVVGAGDAGAGVGVDVEGLGPMRAETELLAFAPEERKLLSALQEAGTDDWPLRLWCAKEAVAKALGRGLAGGPQALAVQGLDASSGIVQITVDGAAFTAFTLREGEWVAAVAVCGGMTR